jgi:hypothetical protein
MLKTMSQTYGSQVFVLKEPRREISQLSQNTIDENEYISREFLRFEDA